MEKIMKKQIGFIFILTHICFACYSQNELTFKAEYRPETKYSQTTELGSTIEIKYSGSDEFLTILKEKKIENPTKTKTGMLMHSVFQTEKLTDSIHFPLSITFVKIINRDGKETIPEGTKIFGYSNGTLPIIDSVFSPTLDEKYKKTLLETLQSTFSQITIPNKHFKIGDTYSHEMPLSMPIAGVTIDMVITTTYKLISIKKGIAIFDITMNYTLKSSIMETPVDATGTGKGKLHYSITHNQNVLYETEQTLTMNIKMEKFSLDLKSKSEFSQKTEITLKK